MSVYEQPKIEALKRLFPAQYLERPVLCCRAGRLTLVKAMPRCLPLRGIAVNIIPSWVSRTCKIPAYIAIQFSGHSNTFAIRAVVTLEFYPLPERSEFSPGIDPNGSSNSRRKQCAF